MLDLRPDTSTLAVDDRCLVWTPDDQPIQDAKVIAASADRSESVVRGVATKMQTDLGVDLTAANDFSSLLKLLMFQPGRRWPGVQSEFRTGIKEIWLAGTRWAEHDTGRRNEGGIDPSDNFNRANETPLASPWARITGSTGNMNLASNAITASATGDKFYSYTGGASTADHFSELKQISAVTENDWGPACRIAAGALSGYVLQDYNGGAPLTQVFKLVTGIYTLVEALTSITLGNGDTLRISIAGSTIKSWLNGTEMTGSPSTDTSLTSGGVGFFCFQTGGSLDDWRGGDGDGTAVAGTSLPQLERGVRGLNRGLCTGMAG